MAKNRLRWAVLAVVLAAAGYWLWHRSEHPVQVLAVLALALTAVAGAYWQSRVEAARRRRTALDAYAERALARERRRKPKRSASRLA
jgi:hypothetical protein